MYYVRTDCLGLARIHFEMENSSLTIRAAAATSATSCENISIDNAARYLESNEGLIWIDVTGPDTPENRATLREKFAFHEMAVEDALQPDERPTLRTYGDTLYISLLVPTLDDEYEEIAFFLRPNALVTIANRSTPVVDYWYQRWLAKPSRLAKGPAYLFHAIIDGIVDSFSRK